MRSEHGCRILVFAGTTEGRKIAGFLNELPAEAYVSVATEYGKKLMEEYENIRILCGRMDEGKMGDFLKKKKIDLVIDATHPFAAEVTGHIRRACEKQGIRCLRCLREESAYAAEAWEEEEFVTEDGGQTGKPSMIRVDSVAQAVDYLKKTKGNIFIATGSKELAEYTKLADYRERCYARVLSTMESVQGSIELGFEGRHLIAMQGPFSKEMNIAVLRQVKADYFVTKDSGKVGGFPEKLEAARETGAVLVVVGRPKEEGMTLEELCAEIEKYFYLRG